jgi:hypothetical protein
MILFSGIFCTEIMHGAREFFFTQGQTGASAFATVD